jgi:hypothetical protein
MTLSGVAVPEYHRQGRWSFIAVLDLPESMTKVQGSVYMGLTNAWRMRLKYMLGVFTLFATLGFIGLWVNEIQDSIQS